MHARRPVEGRLLCDEDGRILEADPELCLLTGFARDDLVDRSVLEFASPQIEEARKALRHLPPEGQVQIESELRLSSGDRRRFRVRWTRDDSRALLRVRDARPASEEAALGSGNRALLAEAEDVARLGSWEWTIRDDIVEWTDELYVIFGVNRGTFVPTYASYLERIAPEDRDRTRAVIERAVREGGEYAMHHAIVRPDGTRRTLYCRGRVIRDADGSPVRALGTAQDVTEEWERAEAMRARNQDLETRVAVATGDIESFTHTVAHDLRAPLRAMSMFANILAREFGERLGEPGLDYAQRIERAARRMDDLLRDLLAYSRILRGDAIVEPVPLDAVVRGALGDLERDIADRGARVRVEPHMPVVEGNTTLLLHAVSNLISNAVKFVPPGRTPEVTIRAERRESMARLWVEDNGIGIAPEHLDRIFAIFQRLHGQDAYPGTGIGLAIVKRAAERLGGGAGVESTLGVGSRFWIELPLAREK